MADHGYCTGYRRENGRVVPVLAALTHDAGREALRSRLQAAVVECARELGRSGLLEEHLADARAAGLIAGRLAVEEPRRDEAASLAWVRVTDDQNETRSRPLAEPLALGDVWRRAQDKLGRDVVQDFDTVSRWPEGSLAVTPPVTRTVFHGLRMAGLAAARGRAQVARPRGTGAGVASGPDVRRRDPYPRLRALARRFGYHLVRADFYSPIPDEWSPELWSTQPTCRASTCDLTIRSGSLAIWRRSSASTPRRRAHRAPGTATTT